MLVYLDESYDQPRQHWLILGALFNPHSKYLHRRIAEIKDAADYASPNPRFGREVKYSWCRTKVAFEVSRDMVDAFWSSTSWFRAIAIETGARWFDWDKFGPTNELPAMKKAIAYKRFTELLLEQNSRNIVGATLLMDQRSKAPRDKFLELIRESFGTPGCGYSKGLAEPRYREIHEFRSHMDRFHVGQVCDLLMGAILNNNAPTKNVWKTRLREYVISKSGVPNLLRESWGRYPKYALEKYFPKFNVWYWTPAQSKRSKASGHPTFKR